MRTIALLAGTAALLGCSAAQRKAEELRGDWTGAVHQDADGFQVRVPGGWKVEKLGAGQVAVVSGDRKAYVVVAPVVGRLQDCGSLLRGVMANRWGAFPGASPASVNEQGRGTAVAGFTMHGGQIRAAVLCSAASGNSAMLFGMAAPADEFDRTRPKLVGVLRSFAYRQPEAADRGNGGAGGNGGGELPMESWQDPTENAFTVSKPAGWRAEGGVQRVSNLDVRTSFRFQSPDGASVIWVGDTRLGTCTVPGPQTMQVPGTGGYAGWCPYATGAQLAESYITQGLGRDYGLSGVQVANRRDRAELSQEADRLPAQAGLQGVSNAIGEADFAASRNGMNVSGRVAGHTTFMRSADPNLVAGSLQRNISGYIAAQGKETEVSRYMRQVIASVRWNAQWIMANRQAAGRDAQATMDYLRGRAELGQRMYEERMESAGKRAEAVGDLLSGTVRLQDQQGNRYQAKAGSNYYYAVEQGLALESDPNRAVVGADVWAPLHNGSVDLRPLEVIQ
ncbi:MAG: hypothetical protein IT163_20885 [Bryobacterales bacterium]|nr:hypothetical protein [Bryobacterales bacterium]